MVREPAIDPLEDLRALATAKAIAELKDADALLPGADTTPGRGSFFADVVLVKGLPGPAEASGGAAMSGADGEAADKILTALGHDPEHVFMMVSRPVSDAPVASVAQRLRHSVEVVDPEVVVALDSVAAEDLAAAFGVERLAFGRAVRVDGRRLVAVDGLEASLAKPERKATVWAQFKAAAPPPPRY